MRVYYPPSPMNFRDSLSTKDVKDVAEEFEAMFLSLILKEALKPVTRDKGFATRTYYEMFADNVGRVLARGGGIGIAEFIIKNYMDERDRHSQERED